MIETGKLARWLKSARTMGAIVVAVEADGSYEEIPIDKRQSRKTLTVLSSILETASHYRLIGLDADHAECSQLRSRAAASSGGAQITSQLLAHIRTLHTQLAERDTRVLDAMNAVITAQQADIAMLRTSANTTHEASLGYVQAAEELMSQAQDRQLALREHEDRAAFRQQALTAALGILQGPAAAALQNYLQNRAGLRELFNSLSDDEKKGLAKVLSTETKMRLRTVLEAEVDRDRETNIKSSNGVLNEQRT